MRSYLLNPIDPLSVKVMEIPAQDVPKLAHLIRASRILYIDVDSQLLLGIIFDEVPEQVEVHLVVEQVMAVFIVEFVVQTSLAIYYQGTE